MGFQENLSEIQKFADDFTAAALTSNIDETGTSGKLGDVTDYTFNSLAFGYYLVYQTGTKEIQSSLVSVDKVGETTVALKGQAPSIEKTADKETVEIGQVVTYTINGVIPDTTGYDSYVYKIHDTLTAGLDLWKIHRVNYQKEIIIMYLFRLQEEGQRLEQQLFLEG